jgi:hypothetical protein
MQKNSNPMSYVKVMSFQSFGDGRKIDHLDENNNLIWMECSNNGWKRFPVDEKFNKIK